MSKLSRNQESGEDLTLKYLCHQRSTQTMVTSNLTAFCVSV